MLFHIGGGHHRGWHPGVCEYDQHSWKGSWWVWVWMGTGRSELMTMEVEQCPFACFESIWPNSPMQNALHFQECWTIHVIHKLPDATPTMFTANMKWHINLFWNPTNSQVSTSVNLTWPPLPLLPVCPLAAPPNTLVTLLYSWWKAQRWLKSHVISSVSTRLFLL